MDPLSGVAPGRVHLDSLMTARDGVCGGFGAGGRFGSQSTFELLLRGGASMRFHPKS